MVLLPTVTVVVCFFAGVAWLAGRAQRRRGSTGQEGLIGQRGQVMDPGHALVLGEIWRVRAPAPLSPGDEVIVCKVEGLTLWVEPAPASDQPKPDKGGTDHE
jgi:membrane-bound serine protease (ClpP class)